MEKPYYLIPVAWSEVTSIEAFRKGSLDRHQEWSRTFCCLLRASAVHAVRKGEDAGEGFRRLLDGCRLGRLLASDSPLCCIRGCGLLGVFEVVQAVPLDVLRASLGEVRQLRQSLSSVRPNVEFAWRAFDNGVVMERRDDTGFGCLQQMLHGIEVRRIRGAVAKNREAFLGVTDLSYPEYMKWLESRREGIETAAWRESLGYFGPLENLVGSRAYWEADCCAIELMAALELYRRDHNEYPPALDALVPQCIESVPMDPFSGMPLAYQRVENDYVLSSVGPTPADRRGKSRRTENYVMHRPREADDLLGPPPSSRR